jgi:hypothetical protein
LNHRFDYLLSAVAMVNVKVDNCDSLHLVPILRFKVGSCNSNVVYIAKTVRARLHAEGILICWVICLTKQASMVSRGSRGTKCISKSLFHNWVARLDHSARCKQSGLPSELRCCCVKSIEV